MDTIRIVLIGAGGYGDTYVRALLDDRKRDGYVLAGVVDPYVNSAPGCEKLRDAGIPFYDTPEQFFAADTADLAVIATPITLHEQQALCVIAHGCNLLLEKPIAATPAAGRRIAAAAREKGVLLAIGFQWCYDEAMLSLKADVDAGLLGRPLDLRALVLWPRDFAYYARGTGWAGRKTDACGRPIYDSVASNATAHYLENMFWLCGEGYNGASIAALQGETWRANAIETYDTAVMLGRLDNGAQLTYVVSHALPPEDIQNPMFEYRFENGVARFGAPGATGSGLTVEFGDGTVKHYGVSWPSNSEKIWRVMDALRSGAPVPCPASAALRHADAIALLRDIQPEAHVFKNIGRDSQRVWVPGLKDRLFRCYSERITLTQAGEEKA